MKTSLIGKALNFGFNEYRFDSYVFNIIKQNLLLNQINLNLTNKHFYLVINNFFKKNIKILQLFKKLGLIKNYFYLNKVSLLITFNFIFNSMFFYKIILLSKNGNKIFISNKALSYIYKKTFNTNLFISTTLGIISIREALLNKIGGILIFMII